MLKPIIEIKAISKKYRYGVRQPYYTLRDSIEGLLRNPLRLIQTKKVNKEGLAEDEFWALRNVSLQIMEGEVVGIIGRNGAGKSTLLKILSQITPPSEGEVILRGRVASLLEVGTGFNPELTGRENIYLNGAILGMKRAEILKKFDTIVCFSEIEKFLDTPVKFYSSGMYTRLAFSVASHLESEIVIVDEVLAVGDTQFQKKCISKMKEIGQEGRTVLMVSHSMQSIQAIATKALCIHEGKNVGLGEVNKIVHSYLNIK